MLPRVSLYFVRHGEGYRYIRTPTKNFYDSKASLTVRGRLMGKALGSYFKEQDIHFDSIFSSTYRRASDTADEIAQYDGLPVFRDSALNDLWGIEKENYARILFRSPQPGVTYGKNGEPSSSNYFRAVAGAANEYYNTLLVNEDDEWLDLYEVGEDSRIKSCSEYSWKKLSDSNKKYEEQAPQGNFEKLDRFVRDIVVDSYNHRFDYEDLDICIVGHMSLAVSIWQLNHRGESVPTRSVLEALYPMKEAQRTWRVDLDIRDFKVIQTEYIDLPEHMIKQVEGEVSRLESSMFRNKER